MEERETVIAFLAALGATVIPIHAEPDGTNINAGCGSTHPEVVAEAVVREQADLGFAIGSN
jgi:phosphoglucosamine mutase